ncbi:Uncharacterised protein [Mycobacterium tuberculosis]|nr:Uncharacterised protein [Mycobacterium tuberculosis]
MLAVRASMMPSNFGWPEQRPSEAMSSVSPMRTTACITLSGAGPAPPQLASGLPEAAGSGAGASA